MERNSEKSTSSFAVETAVRFSALPGLNTTWNRVIEESSLASSLYLRPAASLESAREACEEQLAQPRNWSRLASVLKKASKRYGAPLGSLARLDALAQGKAAVIVTAQQVGYLGGPFYTFIKAYHCTRLAAALESELGVAILPIFWLEDEDHDLAEVSDSYFPEAGGEIAKVNFTPDTIIPNFGVGHYRVPATVAQHIRQMADAIGVQADSEMQALLAECYAGHTLSEAMGRLSARLLGERGLLVIEGSNPDLKQMAAPLWSRIVDVGPALHKLLLFRSQQLQKLELATPLSPTASTYLFYLIKDDFIRRVISYDGMLRDPNGHEETVTLQDLRQQVTTHPESLSPKAALRPLYQDFVLPTVACVAGPTEIAYHAQIQPFYKTLSVVPPALYPRLSVTIADEKISRLKESTGFTSRQVLQGDFDKLANRLIKKADDAGLSDAFQQARGKLEETLSGLKDSMTKLDSTLEGTAGATLGKMLHLLEGLEDKAHRAQKQKHEIELGRLRRLFAALKPRELLAEQGLSTAYHLLRFGRERLLSALDEIPLDSKKHVVVSIPTENILSNLTEEEEEIHENESSHLS
jgi:bacillithiol biosynthesis cysteine-adding enzyme BshC